MQSETQLVYGRWRHWDARTCRPFIYIVIIEVPGKCCLRLCSHTLFKFSCYLIDKAKQNMFTTHTLADMSDARVLRLHPGIDHRLKRRHAVSTLSAIKTLLPLHVPILSPSAYTRATHITFSISTASSSIVN